MRRWVPNIAILLVLVTVYFTGIISSLNDSMRDLRFRLVPRDATGEVVLIQIDAKSLREVGVWPWPRRIYARLLDKLVDAGARDIAFDIDFSAASGAADDQLFEEALARAAARAMVVLPQFRQLLSVNSANPKVIVTKPLARFARHTWPGSVNVSPGSDGIVRMMRTGASPSEGYGHSLIDVLSGRTITGNTEFLVDFAIQPRTVPRLSFGDVLRGDFDAAAVRGRKIIIGGTAAELGDRFAVPVHGVISGPLLQVLGLESILQNRQLHQTGSLITIIGLILLFGAVAFWRERLNWRPMLAALFATSIAIEATALLVQSLAPISPATIAWQSLLVLFILYGLLMEIDLRTLVALVAVGEKKNREQLMRQVVRDSFDGIIVVDADGAIVTANPAASAILQLDHDTLRTGSLIETTLPTMLSRVVMDAIASDPEANAGYAPGEITFPAPNDEMIHVEHVVTQSVLKQSTGKDDNSLITRRIATLMFRDITERKKTEIAMRTAAQEAESANQAKTQFMATMSHELRTPLNSILGFSEIIKDQLVGPVGSDQYVDYASEINTSGNQLLDMLNNILEITKIEGNCLEIDEDVVDMTDLINSVRREVAGWDNLEERTVSFEIDDNLPAIRGDYRILRKIFINLLSNAVKFTASDGRIRILVSVNAATGLIIHIHDNGIGIPAQYTADVTRPFFQVDGELNRQHEGSGLGLALVKAYARAHNGTIEIQSTPGRETSVTVRLPPSRLILAGNNAPHMDRLANAARQA